MKKKKILMLGFGGTIAMVPDEDGVLKPAKNIDEIIGLVPSVNENAEIDFEQIVNLDSTNVNPFHWNKLSLKIASVVDSYDGVLVTHGTDTMAYTAGAVALSLGRGLKIPVVFTGSQLPLVSFGTDARFNLENAVKVLIEAADRSINEVMIVFSDRVLRASRAIKTSESNFMAFDSPAFPHLAQITAVDFDFSPNTFHYNSNVEFNVKPDFTRDILAVDLVPGLEPKLLQTLIESKKCVGILLKSLGAGNVPSEGEYSIVPIIESATRLDIPVLISTKFVGGNTYSEIYEPGKMAVDAGAIPIGDLTDVMAQVKFMWALAQGYTASNQLKEIMVTSFVGEVSERLFKK